MDIALFSKMIRDLILDHDQLTLPGLGSLVAEMVPSSFSDKGYAINPPYRRLYFVPTEGEDSLLIDLYADSNKVSPEVATKAVRDMVYEIESELKRKKSVYIDGLGRLRATRENHFFFVADEDMDIYPYGFALERVSLKNHIPEPSITIVHQSAPAVVAPVESPETPVATPEEPTVVAPAESPVTPEEHSAPVEVVAPEVPAEEHAAESPETPVAPADVTSAEAIAPAEPIEDLEVSVSPETPAVEAPVEPVPVAEPIEEPVVAPAEAIAPAEPIEALEESVSPETPVVEEPTPEEPAETTPEVPEAPAEEADAPETAFAPAAPTPAPAPRKKKRSRWALKWSIGIVATAAILLVGFVALSRIAPEITDSLLYTPEELEIINAEE